MSKTVLAIFVAVLIAIAAIAIIRSDISGNKLMDQVAASNARPLGDAKGANAATQAAMEKDRKDFEQFVRDTSNSAPVLVPAELAEPMRERTTANDHTIHQKGFSK